MSREIKFRAWDKEYEEYMNGYDVLLKYNGSVISRYALVTFDTDMPVNVIIEQYTGLEDKNGKEIYEGDIVLDYYDGDDAFVVEWDKDTASFRLTGTDNIASVSFDNFYSDKDLEVIGNIHENPELLGGEE